MPDCRYCDASFDEEADYLDHLAQEHEDELGRVDKRRVEQHTSDSSGLPIPSFSIGAILVVLLVGGLIGGSFVVFFQGNSNGGGIQAAKTPYDLWGVHYHGTIEM
ncbi:MAG: hypothetical protein ABEI06_02760, partial [Halobacteriaceae archaeon]